MNKTVFLAMAVLAGLTAGCATDTATTAAAPAAAAAPAPTAAPAEGAAPAAPAEGAAPAAAPTKTAAKEEAFPPDQKVCRIYEVTGTRIAKQKICKTREEWAEQYRTYQESVRGIQESGAAQPGGESLSSGP